MVINLNRNDEPLDIEGHILSGKEAEAVYQLIEKINRKERELERINGAVQKQRRVATE